jgi:hypothetical protein
MGDPPLLRVFMSYRREDTAGYAGRLYDALDSRLDVAEVFMDVGDIEPGADFTTAIADAVESCDVMLALIGSRWATAVTPDGTRRLDDPDDYVVAEVAAALERDVRVIPVLIENAPMPAADALPERLRGLARRNAIDLSTVSWRTDLEALLAALHRLTPRSATPEHTAAGNLPTEVGTATDTGATPGQPAPPPGRQPRFGRGRVWAAVAATIVAVFVITVIALASGDDNSIDPADAYVQAVSEALGITECTAQAVVDGIGLDDLEADATPDEIRHNFDEIDTPSESEANSIYDNLSDCPSDKTFLIAAFGHVIGTEETLTPQLSECVRRQFGEDLARRMLVAEITEVPDTSLHDTVTAAAAPCLEPPQLVPASGPPGTIVAVSGECTPPDGWSNGNAAFGMNDQEGTAMIPGIDIPLDPDGSWQGQLPIPAGTSAGTYSVWANCYGDNPDDDEPRFHYYRDAAFEVTNA